MGRLAPHAPDWDRLYEIASTQDGHFTTKQAAEAGYSPQLLLKHLRAGRIARVRRGVYRLVHYPAAEHEELAVAWLWSEHAGVFSHQTALALHGLSDVLPAQLHLTLPMAWRGRRFRIPAGIALHHGDLSSDERVWFGPVPATAVRRTLIDCAREGFSPELLQQATQQALTRGLVVRGELGEVEQALRPFGGLAA